MDATGAGAFDVGVDAGLRAFGRQERFLRIIRRQGQHAGDGAQIRLGQSGGARHQGDVRIPEVLGVGSVFDEFGGLSGDLDTDERIVAKDVADALAELIADLGDAFVGGAAIGAGIAAIFDEGDFGVRGAEGVVVGFVDGAVEPVAQYHLHFCPIA